MARLACFLALVVIGAAFADNENSDESGDKSRRRRIYIRGCRANPLLSHCGGAALAHPVLGHPAHAVFGHPAISTCAHAVHPYALGGACSFMAAPLIPDGATPHGYLQCVPTQPGLGCGVWMPRPCAPATVFDPNVQVCVHADGVGCLTGYTAHGACGHACGGVCHSGLCCHAAAHPAVAVAHPVAAVAHPAVAVAHPAVAHPAYHGSCLSGYTAIGPCGATHTCAGVRHHGTCCHSTTVVHHGNGAVSAHHTSVAHHGAGVVTAHHSAHLAHPAYGHPAVAAYHGSCLSGYTAIGACGSACAHHCYHGTCCRPIAHPGVAVAHPAVAVAHPAAAVAAHYGTCLSGYHAVGACGASCAHTCYHGTCCQHVAAVAHPAVAVAHPAVAVAHPAVAAAAHGSCLAGYHAVGACGTSCAHTCYHGTCCQAYAG